jgi:hypothetical protein
MPTGVVTPCEVEGSQRSCHVQLPSHDRVQSCFNGIQVCKGGAWGDCGGPDVSISSVRVDLANSVGAQNAAITGALSPKSLSPAVSDAGVCLSNPCDPSCVGFNEDAGAPIGADASTTSSYLGIDFNNSVPGGFLNKGLHDPDHGDTPCSLPEDCNFDFHCNFTTGQCVQWHPGERWPSSTCTGIDLTAGVSCIGDTGEKVFPICNRGNTAVPAGTTLKASYFAANSIAFPSTPVDRCNNVSGSLKGTCTAPLASSLKPGECFDVPESQCTTPFTGNITIYVNYDQNVAVANRVGVVECGDDYYPGCSNNWTDWHSSAATCQTISQSQFTATTYNQQYVATCPSGTAPQWTWLTYNATTPSNSTGSSNVKFEVRTAPMGSDGGVGTFSSYVTAANTPAGGDPAVCASGGPAPCPKDLFPILGGKPAATNAVLDLKVTFQPTPDGTLTSTLSTWQIQYSCPPTE